MRIPAANHADFCHLTYAPRTGVSLCGSTLCRHEDAEPVPMTEPPSHCWICNREVCSTCIQIVAENRAKREARSIAESDATADENDPSCLRQADINLERRRAALKSDGGEVDADETARRKLL